MRLLPGRSEPPAADFRADLLAVGEVGFRRDAELRGGFSDPLALTALDVDASAPGVDGERGEEAVAVGAGVLDPAEFGVDLGRVALVAVGAADPFVGGRVDVQAGEFAGAGDVVDVGVSVDSQQDLVRG